MHGNTIPSEPTTRDEWDIKAARIHGEPRVPEGSETDPVVTVVTGIHLTFDNVFALVIMFTVSNLIIAAIIGLALFLFGVI